MRKKELKVEIADTPLKREQGLMGRKRMDENSGMLFKFPYARKLSFWMKNTYMPLHIAFIEEDGTIFQIEEMIPLNYKAVNSKYECKYALEVPLGWFKDNEIDVGSKMYGSLFGNVENVSKRVYCNYTHGKLYSISQRRPRVRRRNLTDQEEANPEEIPQEIPMPMPEQGQELDQPQDIQPNIPQMGPEGPEEGEQEVDPGIQVINTLEQKFALANKYGMDLIMVYNQIQTNSDGKPTGRSKITAPRTITLINGEYAFEHSTRGNSLVRVYDKSPRIYDRDEISGKEYARNTGEKTFNINNIISLDFKPEDETILRARKEIQ